MDPKTKYVIANPSIGIVSYSNAVDLEIRLILYLLSGILGIQLIHLLASVFPNILIKLTD
jgi:hypothetical protein